MHALQFPVVPTVQYSRSYKFYSDASLEWHINNGVTRAYLYVLHSDLGSAEDSDLLLLFLVLRAREGSPTIDSVFSSSCAHAYMSEEQRYDN